MPPGRPKQNMSDDEILTSSLGVTPPVKKERPKREPEKVVFELVGDFKRDPENGTIKYPPQHIVNNEHTCWDEEKGVIRQARVLRGVATIWRDEQDKITESYARQNRVEFHFINGKLTVPSMEKNHILYLTLRSDFTGCKKPTKNIRPRYKLVDTFAAEAASYEKMMKQMEARNLANEADIEDVIPHFKHLGGNMKNQEGEDLSDDGLRAAYIKLAEEKTKLFLDTYNNPIVKMFGLVRLAFEKNLISFVDGQCTWNDTKTFICQVPPEEASRVADFLAKRMLTNEGVELRSRLENLK